ncbi:MAG: CheR family methyltransferase [Gemmatimonadaceae bacterium]
MSETRSGVRGVEWSGPEISRIARWLHSHAGLTFPPNRRESAELGIRRVMGRAGIKSVSELGNRLERGGSLLDDLIAELTIGETFFLREPNQLEFIQREVLPAVSGRDGSCRAVRVWSAGCASGEEPYSLAILLQKTGCLNSASIIGTDLSVARLLTARRGRYRSWSLRGVPEAIINQYFERDGGVFTLKPQLRSAVDFRLLNLAEDAYPSPATGVFGMDVILCRNVLIYFDAHTVAQVAQRLLNTLSDAGWLFLGASDPSLSGLVPCDVVMTGAGIAYRKPGAAKQFVPGTVFAWRPPSADASDTAASSFPFPASHSHAQHSTPDSSLSAPPASPLLPLPAHSDIERAYAASDYERVASMAHELLASGDPTELVSVALVRSLANRGMMEEAARECAAALARNSMSAELHYLAGMLQAQGGEHEEAARSARRALYLDPELTIAHLALAEALARTGDSRAAKTALRNAEKLLAAVPADSRVRATDGETASRLLHIARFRLRTLTFTKT